MQDIKSRIESKEMQELYETVAESVSATEEITEESTDAKVNPYTVPSNSGSTQSHTNTMTSASNSEMVGWIKIDGTNINYPVMQTPNDPDYYLSRDFYKNNSVYGCPYVQANCNVTDPSDNVIIYAHHMNDGSMFANLELFRSKDFWKSHKQVSFDTLDKKGKYEILAVFAVPVDENDAKSFKYYEFVNSYDPQHFTDFVKKCKELSFYDTGVTAKHGDKLLTFLASVYGLRRSEVLGLKWHNVDFENGTIWIRETLQQCTKDITGESNYTSETKTESSNRTLPMTQQVREVLLKQKQLQQEHRSILERAYYLNDYVCTFDNGKEISPNYLSRTFHKIIKKTDLPTVRFHDLRHSVASNLLNDGFTTVQVAEWLGHSNSTTTLKFYAHIDKTSKMAIANSLAPI